MGIEKGAGVENMTDFATLQEVADLYYVTVPAVRKWVDTGLLEGHRDGRRIYMRITSL